MKDPDWDSMDDREFDDLLENSFSGPPPEQIVSEVTPWKQATKRVLIGVALTTITLNFWWLNYILPAIGTVLMLLGFRALRRENRWFESGFWIVIYHTVYLYVTLILNSTILLSKIQFSPGQLIFTGINIILQFILLFCLWGGFRAVQQKAGLTPHAGSAAALMVWYIILLLLALVQYTGFILLGVMLVSYICILRSLWKLSKELDQAGYAVRPAPVRITDGKIAAGIAVVLAAGCVCGLLLGCKYPMEWQAADPDKHSGVEEIKAQLLELGFPDYVLNDLTAEDIAACDGALRVVTDVHNHSVDNSENEPLRITGVAVELPGQRGRWMIFHHFLWLTDPGFYGTESIQLWPTYQYVSEGWSSAGGFSGRVLYDKDGTTYSAPYYFLGDQTFTSDSIFWGEQTSTDIFAAFSMPGTGENQRGYLAYPVAEVQDGYIMDSWFNYTHQRTALQYPVMTAMEARMSNSLNWYGPFYTVQDALQFYPTAESADLLS